MRSDNADRPFDDAEIECALRAIWADLLELRSSEIVPASNFLELGANSMLILSLQVAIANAFGLEYGTDRIVETPDFAGLVAWIARERCLPGSRFSTAKGSARVHR